MTLTPPLARDVFARAFLALLPFTAAGCSASGTPAEPADDATTKVIEPDVLERFAGLALDCADKEYPNKISHVLNSDDDVAAPSELTPAFFGCFDWHSAVHGHWLLARLARLHPEASFASRARDVLRRHLTAPRITIEAAYLTAKGRASWERPYGLAWLLQLATELREWDDPEAKQWSENLAPLERAVAAKLADWLPKLSFPNRTGEHSQTAFAMGLMLDWARAAGEEGFATLVADRARAFHASDRDWPLRFEPGGQDFLSAGLAAADLMRRVLSPEEFAEWLDQALPEIPEDPDDQDWLQVAVVTDKSDGKLAHLDGLNLSRAWMLDGIAAGLPEDDRRLATIRRSASAHGAAGVAATTGEDYAGGHWLGSFAVYYTTGRGLD